MAEFFPLLALGWPLVVCEVTHITRSLGASVLGSVVPATCFLETARSVMADSQVCFVEISCQFPPKEQHTTELVWFHVFGDHLSDIDGLLVGVS